MCFVLALKGSEHHPLVQDLLGIAKPVSATYVPWRRVARGIHLGLRLSFWLTTSTLHGDLILLRKFSRKQNAFWSWCKAATPDVPSFACMTTSWHERWVIPIGQ